MERVKYVLKKIQKICLKMAAKPLAHIPWRDSQRPAAAAIHQAVVATADDPAWEERYPHYRKIMDGYLAFPYPGRVTLLRTKEHWSWVDDPTLMWSHVTSDVEIHMIPGDHVNCVIDPEHLAVLGERLKSCLDRQHAATERAEPRDYKSELPEGNRRTPRRRYSHGSSSHASDAGIPTSSQ